jgi:hypothetical protein
MSRRAVLASLLAISCTTGVAACGGTGGSPTAAPPTASSAPPPPAAPTTTSPAPPASTSPSAGPGGSTGSAGRAPAFPADTRPDGGPAQAGATSDPAGQMHVTALRLGAHPGYDRLVVQLSSAGVPDWRVAYGERSGPGGGPVTIAGDSFLRLSLVTRAEPGVQTTLSVSRTGVVAQARTTGFFEGYEEVLIGLRGAPAPFRAFALTDPGRIVVDVRTP